ncbi:MAG: ABC transporter ATP-binding protein [Vicinamibacteria bacterium]
MGGDSGFDILRITGVSKSYGLRPALEDVEFSVRAGEILGLIGPNGAGKTTLFECLAGILPARSGAVTDGGRTLDPRERRRLLFYLPDAMTPWPDQPVGWALDFAIGFFRGRASTREDIVRDLGLATLLSVRLGALSKGQRKRVHLALALLMPQPVLLVDEPFDGLDLRQSREVAATLTAHARAGRTLVLSIHQIGDAARLCDRFVLLSEGRVRGEGTLDELTALASKRGSSPMSGLEEVFLALT